MSETIAEKVAYYRAKHCEWQQMGPGDRYEQHDAIGVLFRALDEAQARAERAEDLIRVLLENEPDDAVSDGGHTVLDLWRHDARAALNQEGGE